MWRQCQTEITSVGRIVSMSEVADESEARVTLWIDIFAGYGSQSCISFKSHSVGMDCRGVYDAMLGLSGYSALHCIGSDLPIARTYAHGDFEKETHMGKYPRQCSFLKMGRISYVDQEAFRADRFCVITRHGTMYGGFRVSSPVWWWYFIYFFGFLLLRLSVWLRISRLWRWEVSKGTSFRGQFRQTLHISRL